MQPAPRARRRSHLARWCRPTQTQTTAPRSPSHGVSGSASRGVCLRACTWPGAFPHTRLAAAAAEGAPGPGPWPQGFFPKGISGDLPFRDVAAGRDHFCGIDATPYSNLYCWGSGYFGELGNGRYAVRPLSFSQCPCMRLGRLRFLGLGCAELSMLGPSDPPRAQPEFLGAGVWAGPFSRRFCAAGAGAGQSQLQRRGGRAGAHVCPAQGQRQGPLLGAPRCPPVACQGGAARPVSCTAVARAEPGSMRMHCRAWEAQRWGSASYRRGSRRFPPRGLWLATTRLWRSAPAAASPAPASSLAACTAGQLGGVPVRV